VSSNRLAYATVGKNVPPAIDDRKVKDFVFANANFGDQPAKNLNERMAITDGWGYSSRDVTYSS